jgi:hypothetical protein
MTRYRALPPVAAYAADVQPGTLRQWARRGHISPPDADGCYDLTEILAWSEKRSHRHAVSARHQRHTRRVLAES